MIRKKSFTLVELLISVAALSIVLPPLFAIFFSMMRQQVVLIAYNDMIKQGDNTLSNVKSLLQQRAVRITDSGYTTDICPILTSPTPTYAPNLYMIDIDGKPIRIYQELASPNRVASDSAFKTYYLTTKSVVVTNLGFSCFRLNDKTPPIVQVSYSVKKSALYKDISLPYIFSSKIRTN